MKMEAIAIVFIQFLSEILQEYLLLQDFIMSESRLFSISQAQPAPQFCSTPVPCTLSFLLCCSCLYFLELLSCSL